MIMRVIHQQVRQVMWQFLACLGLVMILPIEEAFVNLKDGDGFYSHGMSIVGIMIAMPLMGLIACSNVQADFREGRCDFWRSRPIRTKIFVTLKFFIGLMVALVLMACPAVFGIVSGVVCNGRDGEPLMVADTLGVASIIGAIVYSFCFASNMVIRRTARGWLIGLAAASLAVFLPFILPLGIKDIGSDLVRVALRFYLTMSLLLLAGSFIFSLIAASRNWHLRTNLKGLMWAVAGLLFALMMFFSSQVANIKVLDEKEVKLIYHTSFQNFDGEIVFNGQNYVELDNNKISLRPAFGYAQIHTRRDFPKVDASYEVSRYPNDPWGEALVKKIDDDLYAFELQQLFRRTGPKKRTVVEKVFLVSHKYADNGWQVASTIDISDSIDENKGLWVMEMRLIDDRLVVLFRGNVIVADTSEPEELELVSREPDLFMRRIEHNRRKEFSIPLLPVEGVSIEERVKLSIDLAYGYDFDVHKYSMVDMHDGKMVFVAINRERGVTRYDITGWDDKKVYCQLGAFRNFTFLERRLQGGGFNRAFVKDGRLYSFNQDELYVFDIRLENRIRKLGHIVRGYYDLRDIEVLADGNILVGWWWEQRVEGNAIYGKSILGLLEKP